MIVYIIRGLPGSGKSTLAGAISKKHKGAIVCNADSYHMKNGVYAFDPSRASQAHAACLKKFVLGIMKYPEVLIVDNTNTTGIQMAPYVRVAEAFEYEVRIIEMKCSILDSVSRNVHGVPEAVICRMAMYMSQGLPVGWDDRYGYIRAEEPTLYEVGLV